MSDKKDNFDNSAIEISDQSGEQFTTVWNWFLDLEDLSDKEKMIWIALKSYAGYQEIRPTIKSISKRASVSISTTRRTLASLAKKGLIRIDPRQGTDGGSLPNRYTLLPIKAVNKAAEVGCQGDTPPCQDDTGRGCHVDTPSCQGDARGGVGVTPEKDKYYKNKLKTTTPLTPLEPGVEPPGSGRGFFEQILSGTLFVSADPVRISRAAAKYGRAADYVALAVDVLDQQYRQSKRGIDDVTALIVATLKDGIDPPEGYVPRVQREAAAAVKREEACTRVQEEQAGKQAFAEAEMLLLAMPDGEREKIFDEARAKIHKKFRTSSVAVRSMAVEILMQRARAPGTV